jgi:hypothetical protein
MTEAESNIGETLSQTLGQVGVLYRTAGKKVQDARCGTADALSGSASTVRDTAEAIDELAESTATKLDSTAPFVRNYDPGDAFVALGKVIGRHAAIFLTGAVAAGFVLGFAARSKFSASRRSASGGPVSRDR